METISTHPGDYSQRDIDTRTKETPSTKDLEEINQAIKLLMERYEVTPTQNPFGFLWLANCALYSVVCAFLLMKGWKKQGPIKRDNPQDRKEKLKRIYDQEVVKIILPHVRESMTVLDSGSHPVDSGFRVLDSGFQLSGFRIPKRAGFQIFSVLMLFFAFRFRVRILLY